MSTIKNTYDLFQEILETKSLEFIADELSLHMGTLRRWRDQQRVPENYFNDLNYILGNKYEEKNSFRDKDQFYTKDVIAKYTLDKTLEVLKKHGIKTEDYIYLEPSAGNCNFYELLPKDRRIGIDIEPKGESKDELIEMNYLSYKPKNKNGKYIVIGNPPFGLRGNLALRFINHSSKFADVVAFILPPLFKSNGKGVPGKRVKGYKLIHTEDLPLNSYYYPNGNDVEIATIFQIWSKVGLENYVEPKIETANDFIRVYSLSNGSSPSSRRNVKMIGKCDVYLPSTTFGEMKAYESFDDLPHGRGYGVVFKKEKTSLRKIFFQDVDWGKVAFLSTNSALNLRTELIEKEVIERGFKDET